MDLDKLASALQPWDAEDEGTVLPEEPPESRWLFPLCTDYLNMSDETSESGVGLQLETHGEVCALFEEAVGDCLFRGTEQKLYMALMPRGTYKTSILMGLVVGAIEKNPNIRILIVTHKQKVSQRRLKQVKFHLTNNVEWQDKYGYGWKPAFRDDVWSDSAIVVAKRTAGLIEPTVDVASVGADMTGSHYDLIIPDDLVNRDNVRTLEQRNNVYDFLDSLQAQLDPGGSMIVTGTRWHVDDAYGRINKDDDIRIANGKQPRYKKFIRSCWDGPGGLFFPRKQTFQFLEEMRNRPGGARFFAANYENKPVADEDRVFDISQVHVENFELYRINNTNVVKLPSNEQYPVSVSMTWDPAGRNPTRKSDYHGVTIVGTDFADNWWTFVAGQYKGQPSDILDRMCTLVGFYRPVKLVVENVGGYGLWIDLLQRELRQRGMSVNIEEDNVGGQSKSTRIQMLEPRIRSGRLYLLPQHKALYEQIENFSSANELVHEDILDSLAKHEGRTVKTVQRVPQKIEFFEVDQDYIDYLKENKKPGGFSAGHHGVIWKSK